MAPVRDALAAALGSYLPRTGHHEIAPSFAAGAFLALRDAPPHGIPPGGPADRHPAIGGALHRVAQAVWVVMQILQRHGLRADMSTAERVGLVTTDSVYVISVVLYLDTAHGFA